MAPSYLELIPRREAISHPLCDIIYALINDTQYRSCYLLGQRSVPSVMLQCSESDM